MDEPGSFVEEEKRFSESILWKLQRQFYDLRGPNAWYSGTVPSYITSNPYIAELYAQVVLTYLRDAVAAGALDPGQPVHIVELAAGSGRFAYLFLKKLHALKRASSLRALDCRYVMTDFTRNNLRAWAAQPLLKPFLDAGTLHLGMFDLERDDRVVLLDGSVLSPRNPLVAVANYAFDTLVQDLFRVENGKLHETRVSLRSKQAQLDMSRPEAMSELQSRYSQREVGTDYYDDADLNRILAGYRERLVDTTFAMPIGAFHAVRRLLEMSGGRLFLLSSDKGFVNEDELHGMAQQPIEFHGSLSMIVNYHAIGEYFSARSGFHAATSQRDGTLKTVALFAGGEPEAYADTLLAFRERADLFGAYDLYALLHNQRKDSPTVSVDHFLGLLRLSRFDPYVVHHFGKDVVKVLPGVSDVTRLELRLALERVWENYYPVGNDLPFDLARLYLALGRPLDGVRFNQASIDLFGENAATYTNMAMCHYYGENGAAALRCLDRALAISPQFAVARAWRSRVVAELDRLGRLPAAGGAREAQPSGGRSEAEPPKSPPAAQSLRR